MYAHCDPVVFVTFDHAGMNAKFGGYYTIEVPEEKNDKLFTRESTGYSQYKHVIHNRWIVYHNYGLEWAHSDKKLVRVKGDFPLISLVIFFSIELSRIDSSPEYWSSIIRYILENSNLDDYSTH